MGWFGKKRPNREALLKRIRWCRTKDARVRQPPEPPETIPDDELLELVLLAIIRDLEKLGYQDISRELEQIH